MSPAHASAAASAASAARPSSGLIDFFRHHGIWAPGVRLFRRLGFRAKAAIISAVFLLPLVLVFSALWRAEQETIDFAAKERVGVATIEAFAHFFNELTNTRNAARAQLGGLDTAADYSAARGRGDTALTELDALLKRDGDPLALQPAVDKLRSTWAAIATSKAGVDAQGRTVFGPVAVAARDLLARIGDDSNLVLDPDVTSFYLINAAVLTMPPLMENLGQVWGWGSYASAKGSLDKKQLANLNVWLAQTATGVADLRDYIGRATKATPDLKARMALDGLDKVEAFQRLVHAAVVDGQPLPAAQVYAQGRDAVTQLDKLYDSVLPVIEELLTARIDAANASRRNFSVLVLVCTLVGGYLFYAFYLVTHGGLREVQKHLEAMTDGDLTTSPRPWGHDEAALLMVSIHEMQSSLRAIVGQVRGASDAIVTASHEIAQASNDLSGRTEQAAANLEESASSMEQLSANVQQTADQARDAARLAAENAAVAQRGGSVVGDVVSTMQGIHGASRRIADIIGTIDGIAFQTNILALNAAVEAARAGEQGRGFAVVAGEVRSLAQRSAEAAREIKSLISSSVEQVEAGTRVVQGAGDTMRALVDGAQRIDGLLSSIATAAQEQSAGVTQVGTAVNDLDHMTQQNAALVEQSAAAASGLAQQAGDLAARVQQFRLPA